MREFRVSLYRALSSKPTVVSRTDGGVAHGIAHQWVTEALGRRAVVEHREVGAWFEAGVFESEGQGTTPTAGEGMDAQAGAAAA